MEMFLHKWMEHHNTKSFRIAMSDTPWTFRMDVYKPYKMHRADKRKPLGLKAIRQFLFDDCGATFQPGLEADDLMGLWMTDRYRDNGIIVSWDKDMRAVPGRFWVPGTEEVEERDTVQADLMWFAQALSGDAADGYPGCKNVGVVRAKRIVEEALAKAADKPDHVEVLWECVKAEFLKKGQTEEEALTNTRLARILRHGDYDLKEKKVRLWMPPGSPSSSRSTVMPRARGRARAPKSLSTWPATASSRSIRSRSRTRYAEPLDKSYPLIGRKRSSAIT